MIQFIKTDGRVAYLLDTKRGVVMKVLVEDYTGGAEAFDAGEEDNIERAPYRPRARRVPVLEDEAAEVELPAPAPQFQRPKSIMPPGMRGIFTPPEHPGADVERRTV